MKHKKTKNKIFIVASLFAFSLMPFFSSASEFRYIPMEAIPGFDRPTDFYAYVSAIYKFGLWAVGIAALLMIVIGGFMYITSAGNNASMEKAKSVITDAIAGLLLALTSWLILYTINPALVTLTPLEPTSIIVPPTLMPTTRIGTGRCAPVGSGPCSVGNLQSSSCFNTDLLAYKASGICRQESGGIQTRVSGADKCKDGNSFSIGLFQINLIAHGAKLGAGCDPKYIFTINGTATLQGNKLEPCPDGKTTCKYDCTVKDIPRYTACANLLTNPVTNINLACTISSGGTSWRPWGANSICGF